MTLKIKLNPLPKTYPNPPTMWAGDGLAAAAMDGVNSGVLHGVLPGAHIIGDDREYFARRLNSSKDFTPYVTTPPTPQSGNGADSMGCTAHGAYKSFAAYLTYCYHNNLMSDKVASFLEDNGYFDENGRVSLDYRILVVESGTTENGNYLDIVNETIRKHIGIIPARPYDWSKYTRKDYFAIDPKIREEQIALGKKSLGLMQFLHRWIAIGERGSNLGAVIDKYLEYGPLYAASATHAFVIIKLEGTTVHYYDSYTPYLRTRDLSSLPQLWLKQIVVVETTEKPAITHLPHYERVEGQSIIAVYDPKTDMMVPIDSGETYKMVNHSYKDAKIVKEWSRKLDLSRVLTVIKK